MQLKRIRIGCGLCWLNRRKVILDLLLQTRLDALKFLKNSINLFYLLNRNVILQTIFLLANFILFQCYFRCIPNFDCFFLFNEPVSFYLQCINFQINTFLWNACMRNKHEKTCYCCFKTIRLNECISVHQRKL